MDNQPNWAENVEAAQVGSSGLRRATVSFLVISAALFWAEAAHAQPKPTPEPTAHEAAPRLTSQAAPPADTPAEQPEARPAPVEDGMAYAFEATGVEGELADYLVSVSTLQARSEAPAASRAVLFRRIEKDLERFEAALKSRGYYAYRLAHRVEFDQQPIKVAFDVDPGPPYQLDSFDILYGAPGSDGLVVDPAALGVEVGGPALSEPTAAAPARLLRRLGEAGYPLAKIAKRSAVVDHDAKAMRVTLTVEEGPRAVFGKIESKGLDRVDHDYVVRVADLPPGARFDVARIDDARRRLFSTGLFEGLQIEFAEQATPEGALDILIEATERDRRTISLGLNYSTTEGAGGDVEWTHRNLFGQDEDLTLTFRVAELEQSARAELAAPNFWRLGQRAFVASEAVREDTDAFEERRLQVEAGLSRPYGQRWRVGGGGELAIAETIENGISEDNVVLAFPLFATYEGADDPFDPSKGYKLDFRATPAAVTLDTTEAFMTLAAGGSTYAKVTDDRTLILAARSRAAVIIGADRNQIPAGRRLYAGGGGSIRGFEFQSVGPLDGGGDPDGGKSLLEFGLEARWRVTEDIGIVPFIDGGSAFPDIEPDFGDVRFGAGLGLRYYTPIGPLRLDVATPIDRRDGENLIEVYISLGQSF